jgi:hypothetical protein
MYHLLQQKTKVLSKQNLAVGKYHTLHVYQKLTGAVLPVASELRLVLRDTAKCIVLLRYCVYIMLNLKTYIENRH